MEHKNNIKIGVNILQKRRNNKKNIISNLFHDYCSNAAIHGVGYLGANDKSTFEKIWWFIILAISLGGCSYLIAGTYLKWKRNPVILSFAQEQTSVWEIPFPAVSICPLNKIDQLVYNYTEMYRQKDKLRGAKYKQFWDLSLICGLFDHDMPYFSEINITNKAAIYKIIEVAPKIKETIFNIRWLGNEFSLNSKIFAEQLTHEGVCFTFNSFSHEDMFTKHVDQEMVYINHRIENEGWKLETGYPQGSSGLNIFPMRTAKDGSGSGLSVQIASLVSSTDLVCGPMTSGFKIILHNPAETPKPFQQYFLIPMNQQIVFAVTPDYVTTSEYLHSMSVNDRKCYFAEEKSLKYYKVYTQNNCRSECSANVTNFYCGCVPFYMPIGRDTRVCGFGRMNCTFQAEAKMLEFEMMDESLNTLKKGRDSEIFEVFKKCNCLPACFELQYSADMSKTDLHTLDSLVASGLVNLVSNETADLFENHMYAVTQLDIFFKKSQFLAIHRSELFGQIDFLSNCGGLLGLFMGFSLLSLIEIFYFVTIRLWIKLKKRDNCVVNCVH